MKQKLWVLSLLLFVIGYLSLVTEKVFSQEQESILDKILRPLPAYDPFDKPPPSHQFFPDEVHRRVRAALIDALTNREGALEEHVRFFMNRDRELKKERGSVTGLTEQAADLFTNTVQDRQRYLQAQRQLLASSPSPNQRKLIEARLRNDDLTQAAELLRTNTTNRWGGVLNRLLSSVDLISILSGSYVGAAVDSAVSQWVAGDWGDMSIEERKALTLYREHLKRYPDDPQNGEVQKRVEYLEKKRKRVVAQKQITLAKEASAKGETSLAEFHYGIAGFLESSAPEVEQGLNQLRDRSHQQEEYIKRGLLVATRERAPNPAEDRDTRELLYALSLRNPERIEAHARAIEGAYRGKGMAESARDARAVALEIKGQHEEAKKILKEIADSSLDPHEKRRAKLLMENRDYNLLASFHDARSQHRLQTVKYVILGDDFLKRNLLYGTAPLIASGPAGAGSLAAANVIMIGTNLFEALTSNPISYQSIIDKGEAYIRSHPQAESASEVYEILAETYEEVGMYDKAIAYRKMSGKAPEKQIKQIADLSEKAAKALLKAAANSRDRSGQEAYLRKILVDYPDTAAGKEAAQKLAALAKIETQRLRISKKFLMENPELYGPEGLSLKPTLFDENLSNMELADEGVSLLTERELLLHFKTPWGLQSQAYPIEKESSEIFQATLRRKNYEIAMGDVNERAKGSPGGIDGLPPPRPRGELDKKETETGDAAMTLVREAAIPPTDSPRVLHHQLLSETEKDSGSKWKLPAIQGSLSASRFDLSGSLPAALSQNRLSVGADEKSPFAGLQLSIPLLQGFIPVDFLVQGGPGRLSLFPKIHLSKDQFPDKELYR